MRMEDLSADAHLDFEKKEIRVQVIWAFFRAYSVLFTKTLQTQMALS